MDTETSEEKIGFVKGVPNMFRQRRYTLNRMKEKNE